MSKRKGDAMNNGAKTSQKTREQILKETFRFTQRDMAFAFAGRAEIALWVMLGDDLYYWVTTPANCARLEKMGYEWAD
jgi:hypothetical protein